MSTEIYKRCGHCGKIWTRREDLVQDPDVVLVGFQPTSSNAADGLYLLNHNVAHCRTTLALRAGDFADCATPCAAEQPRPDTVVCPGHCLRVADLAACKTACELNWVREVMQYFQRHALPVGIAPAPATADRLRRTA